MKYEGILKRAYKRLANLFQALFGKHLISKAPAVETRNGLDSQSDQSSGVSPFLTRAVSKQGYHIFKNIFHSGTQTLYTIHLQRILSRKMETL